MKKILSVIMAVMMLFGTLAIGASAAATTVTDPYDFIEGNFVNQDQVVLVFNFNGGSSKTAVRVYDTSSKKFVSETVSGTYIMAPETVNELVVGNQVTLPSVTPPSGSSFVGWYCEDDGITYTTVPNGYTIPAKAGPSVITFTAWYEPAEAETDVMTTILGILTKVFGAIIGILLYNGDTEAGVALMEKMLGGIMG